MYVGCAEQKGVWQYKRLNLELNIEGGGAQCLNAITVSYVTLLYLKAGIIDDDLF